MINVDAAGEVVGVMMRLAPGGIAEGVIHRDDEEVAGEQHAAAGS